MRTKKRKLDAAAVHRQQAHHWKEEAKRIDGQAAMLELERSRAVRGLEIARAESLLNATAAADQRGKASELREERDKLVRDLSVARAENRAQQKWSMEQKARIETLEAHRAELAEGLATERAKVDNAKRTIRTLARSSREVLALISGESEASSTTEAQS